MSIPIDYRLSPQSYVAPFLASRILQQLQTGKKVLWLLSGGSGIHVCVQVGVLLADKDLTNLYVTMSDERYGTIGHSDENMQQLLDAGLSLPGASIYRPLIGEMIQETTNAYDAWLTSVFDVTDYHIALLGIGEDGHTSGIKPHSPAVHIQTAACHFSGEDYERITTTADFLSRFDEAVIQAYGQSKQAVVRQLQASNDLSLDDFPAGLIRNIPLVTLLTDTNKEEMI